MRRSKPGLIASIAALIELVLVAITGNQAVTDFLISDHVAHSLVQRDLEYTITAFSWRFGAKNGATSMWSAQLVGVAVLVALTFVFVLAIARGFATFGRVFFGTWFAVGTAATFAVMARALVADLGGQIQGSNRIAYAIFEIHVGFTSVFALLTGLVAALGAAITAAVSARPAADVGAVAGEYPAGGHPPVPFGYPAPDAHAAPEPWQTPDPGQPPYGQPAYGQPAYGQPAYGQPAPEPSAQEQPAYGQPAPEPSAQEHPTYRQPAPEPSAQEQPAQPTTAMPEPYVGGERPTAVLPELPDRGVRRKDGPEK